MEIPVIDLSAFLAGEPGADVTAATELRDALERVGFFFVTGHGVPWSRVADMYAEAARLHAQPESVKAAVKFAGAGGFLGLGGGTSYASRIAGKVRKPNLNAAYFLKRDPKGELPQYPPLDGFKEAALGYMATMEGVALSLLPLYAQALTVPKDFFESAFQNPDATLRISHYPLVPHEENQWGLAAHTDSTFLTILPANDIPGLQIRPEGSEWIDAPGIPGSFLINSGDILKRWTNDRFLSTAHRVLNVSGKDRYAIPYFFGPDNNALIGVRRRLRQGKVKERRTLSAGQGIATKFPLPPILTSRIVSGNSNMPRRRSSKIRTDQVRRLPTVVLEPELRAIHWRRSGRCCALRDERNGGS